MTVAGKKEKKPRPSLLIFSFFPLAASQRIFTRSHAKKKERKKEKKVPQFPALLPRKGDAFCVYRRKKGKKEKKERKKKVQPQ